MKYWHETYGVSLGRDVWAENYGEPGHIITNYTLRLHGETIDENKDPHALAKAIRQYVQQFEKIAKFLEKKK